MLLILRSVTVSWTERFHSMMNLIWNFEDLYSDVFSSVCIADYGCHNT